MEERLSQLLEWMPVWAIFAVVGFFCVVTGIAIARKIWGGNFHRLQTALDDSAYLANQWATLGISQSQLVEKLGKQVVDRTEKLKHQEESLKQIIANREASIQELKQAISERERTGRNPSASEIEALGAHASEIEKRDQRIRTLEARLQHLDSQLEQNTSGHQNQVKILLERVATLEKAGGGKANAEIVENNRKLSDMLQQRCEELEKLRDEFESKENDLEKLKQHNSALKKSVDDLVLEWTQKKGQSGDQSDLQEQLASMMEQLNQARTENETLNAQLEQLESGEDDPATRKLESELGRLRADLEDRKGDLHMANAQIQVLLDVIESHDSRVDELERQISEGGNSNQVHALSLTIADLQTKLVQAEEDLAKARKSAETSSSHHVSDSRLQSQPESASTKRPGKLLPRRENNRMSLFFGENSAFINADNAAQLQALARDAVETGSQISVVGFSDQEGTRDFNEVLSVRRAEAVKELLEREGFDAGQIIVKGKGEHPDFAGSGDSWKARRVDLVLLPVAEIVN